MLIRKSLSLDHGHYIDLNEPSVCPMCKHAIKPQELAVYSFCVLI